MLSLVSGKESRNALACIGQGEQQRSWHLPRLREDSRIDHARLQQGEQHEKFFSSLARRAGTLLFVSGNERNNALVISLVSSEDSNNALAYLTARTAGSLMLVSGKESDMSNFARLWQGERERSCSSLVRRAELYRLSPARSG